VPNDFIADYCRAAPRRWYGFASVDPTQPDARAELERCHQELGLVGLKLGPTYQGYDPTDPRCEAVWDYCEARGVPVLIHQATTFPREARLAQALPLLLDEVAIRHPELRMALAHIGHPWEADCAVTIRKHPHLYADISGLHGRPWRFYQALITCVEYGVGDKLLFGSDLPFGTPEGTAAGLRGVNDILAGTALPRVPARVIDGILERDALRVLGLR